MKREETCAELWEAIMENEKNNKMKSSEKNLKEHLLTAEMNDATVYCYKCNYYGDTNMWRDSKEEAVADVRRHFFNWQDTAKGLNEMNLIEKYKRANYSLIN